MLSILARKTEESGRVFKLVIRKYNQFKLKDKIQSYDGPLPHDIQVRIILRFTVILKVGELLQNYKRGLRAQSERAINHRENTLIDQSYRPTPKIYYYLDMKTR